MPIIGWTVLGSKSVSHKENQHGPALTKLLSAGSFCKSWPSYSPIISLSCPMMWPQCGAGEKTLMPASPSPPAPAPQVLPPLPQGLHSSFPLSWKVTAPAPACSLISRSISCVTDLLSALSPRGCPAALGLSHTWGWVSLQALPPSVDRCPLQHFSLPTSPWIEGSQPEKSRTRGICGLITPNPNISSISPRVLSKSRPFLSFLSLFICESMLQSGYEQWHLKWTSTGSTDSKISLVSVASMDPLPQLEFHHL